VLRLLQSSSHVLILYKSSISLSVIGNITATSLSPNAALLHLLTHCIAAKSSGEIPCWGGSNRSPSSLNQRSHSQLEAGIPYRARGVSGYSDTTISSDNIVITYVVLLQMLPGLY
jgi:hypothetical protein